MKSGRKLIFTLFFISGISGLMYQVIWMRMYARFMGVTAHAMAMVLAAFMAGLALGSYLFGKYVDRKGRPLVIFTLLQVGIAAMAGLIPLIIIASIPLYSKIYAASGSSMFLVVLVRTLILFICVLIPATLMGGTLPVLTTHLVRKGKSLGVNLSLLYGLNTAGAVLGVTFSGFVSIGLWGEWATIFIGMALNLIVAAGAGVMALVEKGEEPAPAPEAPVTLAVPETAVSSYPGFIRRVVLIAFFITGFTGFAYEVIWFRQLILFLQTSIYAFSGMMAVYLTGLALGSIAANFVIDRLKRPLVNFGAMEIAIGVITLLNLYLVVFLDRTLPFLGALSVLSATVILIFPMTIVFGAIFPIGTLCYVKSLKQVGSSVGKVFAFDVMGNICGALVAGFVLITALGSGNSLLLLALANIALGLVLVWLQPGLSLFSRLKYLLAAPVAILLILGLGGRDPFLRIIEQRVQRRGAVPRKIFYNREGLEGTVTSYGPAERATHLWINGIGMTTLGTFSKVMAHLPIMLAEDPKEVLVICFGMGTTARSALVHDDINVTAVELVGEVYDTFPYYYPDAKEIMASPRFFPVVADGRNFLLLAGKKYDVITIDPAPPIYSAGTVNLYTREFLQICRDHLNPGGVMQLWFPVGTADEIRAVLKTFQSVFPHTNVWCMQDSGVYILGTLKPMGNYKPRIREGFKNPRMVEDISEFDTLCVTPDQLIGYYMMGPEEVREITADAPIVSDNFPYTEFPLWRYLNNSPVNGLKNRQLRK